MACSLSLVDLRLDVEQVLMSLIMNMPHLVILILVREDLLQYDLFAFKVYLN